MRINPSDDNGQTHPLRVFRRVWTCSITDFANSHTNNITQTQHNKHSGAQRSHYNSHPQHPPLALPIRVPTVHLPLQTGEGFTRNTHNIISLSASSMTTRPSDPQSSRKACDTTAKPHTISENESHALCWPPRLGHKNSRPHAHSRERPNTEHNTQPIHDEKPKATRRPNHNQH